jgi:hypothetical protein
MPADPEVWSAARRPGRCTSLGPGLDAALVGLPDDVSGLVDVCQGLLVHEHLAAVYGIDPQTLDGAPVHLRAVDEVVRAILATSPEPLDRPRVPSRRVAGNCRQFTVLLITLLRAAGTPARARCGFSDYFGTGRFEDHWVAEVHDEASDRWVLVDAQVDDVQRDVLGVGVDPLDVPRDRFLVAGEAWRRCRSGEDDPERFGLTVLQESGQWWIAGNLMRDAIALEGTEVLPWDSWAAMPGPDDHIDDALCDLLDELAEVTAEPDTSEHRTRRALLLTDPRLVIGAEVHNELLDRMEPLPSWPPPPSPAD